MKKKPILKLVQRLDRGSKFYSFLYMLLNIVSAFTEGLTFSFLLLAFSIHSAESSSPTDLISKTLLKIFPFKLSFMSCFLLAIGSQLIRSLTTFFSCIIFARISTKMQESLQNEILKKIFSFSFPYVNRFRAGELSDIACLPGICLPTIVANINSSLHSLLFSVALFIFMISISLPLTLIMMVLFVAIGFAYKYLGNTLARQSKTYSDKTVALSSEIVDNIAALRYVHYYQNGSMILSKLGARICSLIQSLKLAMISNSVMVQSAEIIAIFLLAVLLLIGSYLYPLDESGVALLIAFLGASYRFATRVQGFIGSFGVILLNWGHMERMSDFLEDEGKEFLPMGGVILSDVKRSIRFEEVSLKYPGKLHDSINKISFEIPVGATIGFAGTSGAGKSTLLDLLLRLYEPSSGKITADGLNYTQVDLSSWRSLFGIVNQDIFLFNDSIEANVRFGKMSAVMNDVEESAKLAGAHSFIMDLPQGYETHIGERGTRLSGGERQRIAIARALIRNPKILVLDEATSSLDSETERVIQQCLAMLQGKKTVIIVAHRLSTLVGADHIYVIDQGQILEQGTHIELLAQNGKYASLWNLQSTQNAFS